MAPKRRTKRRDAALRRRVPAATGRHAYRRRQSRTHSGRATAQKKSVGSQLKSRKGERIPALLCSTPITSTTRNGAPLYQTPIMDWSERKAAEAKLRASEERYRTLFNLGPVAVYSVDTSGRIDNFNRRAAELWGREPALGDTDQRFCGSFKMFRPDGSFMPHKQCPMAEVLSGKITAAHDAEVLIERPDGSRVIVLVNIRPLKNDRGEVTGAINCFYDITARKRTEEALRESEERLRAIINQSNAGIANCDLNGRLVFANQKFCEMLGYTESELVGKTIFAITHPDDVDLTTKRFKQMVQKTRPVEMEKRYMRKDHSLVWVDVCDTPVLDAAGKPVSAVAVVIDATQRKKAEAALQKSKAVLEERVRERTHALRVANKELVGEIAQRKGLEGQILEISDREQQRLGRELHDGLCQHLTAVAFMARSVALRLKNHRVIEVNDIEKIAQLVNDAATDTRNLSRALHRVDIDSAGCITALEDLVDREIWKIPCRLEIKPSFRIENDVAAAQLYRIAREAVINANKHAHAREIVVALARSQNGIVLSVTDDGVGFQNEPKLKKGLGFQIMKYRAHSIGGRLEIECPKKGGTRVACYLPDKALQSRKRERARLRPFLSAKITKTLAALI
jgi:PAS domain S-box-containing protein